jgi:predicted nucleic acid-binding protein
LAGYFFDSSALAKLYHLEIGTPVVDRIIRDRNNQILISRLTAVELPSAFAIKVRTRVITRDDAGILLRQFRDDLISGRFRVFGLRETELSAAEKLIDQYAHDLRLRALDAIQITVAIALKRQRMVDHFVAADSILCNVAAMEGFAVIKPEND